MSWFNFIVILVFSILFSFLRNHSSKPRMDVVRVMLLAFISSFISLFFGYDVKYG